MVSDLLLREIRDQHAVSMLQPLDHVEFQRSGGILEHLLVPRDELELRFVTMVTPSETT